ncbi:MAG: YbaB/EbfC family nucleoid-associated protein [Acutalibacteraceae bacterium]|nr:YbaB/EbfC family nucleoid-associated protein [Oscillospiraceae bacterium]
MKARIPNQPNRNDMMKKIQEMQANMQSAQEEVEATEFTASAGGGAVEAVVTGAHELKALNIKPDVVDPEDVEMLSDLIIAAVNEATKKAEDAMSSKMEAAQGGLAGLNIPGLF